MVANCSWLYAVDLGSKAFVIFYVLGDFVDAKSLEEKEGYQTMKWCSFSESRVQSERNTLGVMCSLVWRFPKAQL